ncbi:hypothetical protein [Mesobacillus maritimus]|uniref:Histidine kinase n=1 Tax=Mesobacillus maritimus TaxID=1643336 RepID=A0ABS7K1S1_9BACI|nr:hypothetical protein [Mesobacillus maritimus]MBY0096208.1 hypothetical protein [Mesobacillus maritimus]
MKHVRFIVYQFLLVTILFGLNIFFDHYISKPFTLVDFIAICIGLPLLMVGVGLIWKVFIRFNSIRLLARIFLFVPTLILSFLVIGMVEQVFY